MQLQFTRRAVGALAAVLAVASATGAMAQGKKTIVGLPGIPPVFSTVIAYTAEKQGFFKKHGVDVELRPFDSGAAAARAALAGDIDMSISPTPVIVTQISNANANVVGIYGFPNPDWVLASTDASKACADANGQPVGVDSPGGARSLALRSMLAGGCPGAKLDTMQQVALSSNIAPAMIAGQITFGVLHLDDLAVLEDQGKKVKTLLSIAQTNPDSHYLMAIARQDKLKENRQVYVGLLAGLIEAAKFMQDEKNADAVAAAAAPVGHKPDIAKRALKQFLDAKMWAVTDDGLDAKRLQSVIDEQVKVGTITAGKEPVKLDRLIDKSVWAEAAAMVK
jgi:NitT/TauT family transport system substrate-binding protein